MELAHVVQRLGVAHANAGALGLPDLPARIGGERPRPDLVLTPGQVEVDDIAVRLDAPGVE